MGLDMYAYVANRAGQRDEFYDQDIKYNSETGEWDVPEGGVQKPHELAYLSLIHISEPTRPCH
jgi:hypothetical protein